MPHRPPLFLQQVQVWRGWGWCLCHGWAPHQQRLAWPLSSQAVQNVGNMDTPASRTKEAWMEPLQPIVRQGVAQLKDFIAKLVDIEEEGERFPRRVPAQHLLLELAPPTRPHDVDPAQIMAPHAQCLGPHACVGFAHHGHVLDRGHTVLWPHHSLRTLHSLQAPFLASRSHALWLCPQPGWLLVPHLTAPKLTFLPLWLRRDGPAAVPELAGTSSEGGAPLHSQDQGQGPPHVLLLQEALLLSHPGSPQLCQDTQLQGQ